MSFSYGEGEDELLPINVPVVSSVAHDDGVADVDRYYFNYSDGAWDWTERRFMGFRTVQEWFGQVVQSADQLANVDSARTTYTFRQDIASLGKPEQVVQTTQARLRTDSGTVGLRSSYFATEKTYLTSSVAPFTSLPYETVETDYGSNYSASSTGKTRQTTRTFDSYGNITQEISYGDTSVAADEVTTAVDYVANTGSYIVGLPARERVFSGAGIAGSLLSETQHLYDNASWDPTEPGVGTNRYAYADNDPINRSDANGHTLAPGPATGAAIPTPIATSTAAPTAAAVTAGRRAAARPISATCR